MNIMHIKRKEFLQIGSLATASLMLPKFLKAFDQKNMVPPGNKVVVVIQFNGGNDGLNTVIPVTNDIYYKERPRLAIKKEKALPQINEDEILFNVPHHWEWVRISDILNDFLGGNAYESSSFTKEGDCQVIRLGNVRSGFLRLEDSQNSILAENIHFFKNACQKLVSNFFASLQLLLRYNNFRLICVIRPIV
jgi:uncharacterized protein (DUF1501 family)